MRFFSLNSHKNSLNSNKSKRRKSEEAVTLRGADEAAYRANIACYLQKFGPLRPWEEEMIDSRIAAIWMIRRKLAAGGPDVDLQADTLVQGHRRLEQGLRQMLSFFSQIRSLKLERRPLVARLKPELMDQLLSQHWLALDPSVTEPSIPNPPANDSPENDPPGQKADEPWKSSDKSIPAPPILSPTPEQIRIQREQAAQSLLRGAEQLRSLEADPGGEVDDHEMLARRMRDLCALGWENSARTLQELNESNDELP